MTLNDIARIAYETDREFREYLDDEGVATKCLEGWHLLTRRGERPYVDAASAIMRKPKRKLKRKFSAVFRAAVLQLAPFLDDQESKI